MRLILLRHAEAADGEDGRDLDRPLTAYGRATARALGAKLVPPEFRPGRVLVSPALRVTQTMTELAHGLGHVIETEVRAAIYLASVADLMDLLAEDATRDLMLVGHNPGLVGLIRLLAARDSRRGDKIVKHGFAPCALVEFGFTATGGCVIAPGTGRVERFIPPEPA